MNVVSWIIYLSHTLITVCEYMCCYPDIASIHKVSHLDENHNVVFVDCQRDVLSYLTNIVDEYPPFVPILYTRSV